MKHVSKKQVEEIQKVRYLTHFVARAFLISVLCLMIIFFCLITVYLGDLMINSSNGNKKNPLFSAYVIVSPSMVPTIMINDAIVVRRVDNDKYKIGDIISFASSDMNYKGLIVTHRIVDKESLGPEASLYTTKGDNNEVVDPTSVSTSSIYGRVMFKIPKVGYIQSFFSKPINFFICLLIPAMIFIFYDIGRIFFVMHRKVN